MSAPPPKTDMRASGLRPIAPPAPADYTDEVTAEQYEALRRFAPQDESKMGALVHEFRWG